MLKITKSGESLRLEGRIAGPWVGEVLQAVERERPRSRRITLDLSGVTFVNDEGARLLRSLSDSGIEMTGTSRFVAAVLGGSQA